VFPDKKLSFESGAEAAAVAYRFCENVPTICRFEIEEVFGTAMVDTIDGLDVEQRVLAEQPAFNSWLLFWRREERSIAPVNANELVV